MNESDLEDLKKTCEKTHNYSYNNNQELNDDKQGIMIVGIILSLFVIFVVFSCSDGNQKKGSGYGATKNTGGIHRTYEEEQRRLDTLRDIKNEIRELQH